MKRYALKISKDRTGLYYIECVDGDWYMVADVDPVLEQLQHLCDMLHRTNDEMVEKIASQDKEIESLKSANEGWRELSKRMGYTTANGIPYMERIAALGAENVRLKTINDDNHAARVFKDGVTIINLNERIDLLIQENQLLKSNLENANENWRRVLEERDELSDKVDNILNLRKVMPGTRLEDLNIETLSIPKDYLG